MAACSVLLGLASETCASATLLSQAELMRPDAVRERLTSPIPHADTTSAAAFLVQARRSMSSDDWGTAAKAFGESAVLYPTPEALSGYAEARLRGWMQWSNPQPNLAGAKLLALREAHGVYSSALAADDLLSALSPATRAAILRRRDCIAAFLRAGQAAGDCEPLRWIAVP